MAIYLMGLIFLPLAHFSFNIKAIEKLYLSKTDDPDFFKSCCGMLDSQTIEDDIDVPKNLQSTQSALNLH